ncbi:tail assembly protein [Erwinia persicina]|uniref:tail assembly protein n=1 Tax=Erwinia persicina TaxID=55211 RepID=UPI0007874F53|nr:tail assembly protein [Erwinia persicina]MCQ4105149.1 tail assembly protein [Erwinia persicina]UTX11365.1 tail assembly protein [Erwinia persicina]
MLKTMRLKGVMAKNFGAVHRYHVADLRELIRAMCSQVPGFKKYVSNAHLNGVRFAFFSGKENIGLQEFDMSSASTEFCMEPIIEGSKRGGVLQIVIGAVALVAAYFTAGASFTVLGVTASTVTTALTGLGISMALGGVIQMLTPQPNYNIGASSSTDNKPNYAFGSPVNTVAMGYPVPVLYGQREIGGAIISAGSFTSDQQ